MRTSKVIATVLMAAMYLPLSAQSEAGLLIGAEAEKKVNKKLSIGIEAEMRTRDNLKTIDRWKFGIGAEYKLTNWLKADAGYNLLNQNFREDYNYKSSGALNKWRPSYWGIKHRVYASLTGSYKFSNNIKLSLRERWQYTYRPEKTVQRWDYDDEEWENKVRSGSGKSQLRSRFQIEYAPKNALLTPYASMELYNSWGIEKIRYTVGTDIRLNKQHSLGLFYRFQDMKNVDADDYNPDIHYIGLGYKFTF
jgi:opacity protein-like surface antigen